MNKFRRVAEALASTLQEDSDDGSYDPGAEDTTEVLYSHVCDLYEKGGGGLKALYCFSVLVDIKRNLGKNNEIPALFHRMRDFVKYHLSNNPEDLAIVARIEKGEPYNVNDMR